jgi:hypothetical protein
MELIYKEIYDYDSYGNWMGDQTFHVGGDVPEFIGEMYRAHVDVDDKGRIAFSITSMVDGY